MSESDSLESIQRLEAVNKILEGIRTSYPDAKKLTIDVRFEWQEGMQDDNEELCPIAKIEVER